MSDIEQDNSGEYDVAIIGSGIGGLTAGAYLAKSGLKTVIVERIDKVGGYCGSFSKDGFRFDEAVHYINNLGPGGFLREICEELGVIQRIKFVTIDPSDRLIMPGVDIAIYHDLERTIDNLSNAFPAERDSLRKFFTLIARFEFSRLYLQYHSSTFQNVLDQFFSDLSLKTALGLFATTMGLPAERLSALAGLAYFKGSILDGGHHPIGGAQSFSDALANRFKELGGEIILSRTVKQILIHHNNTKGIVIDGDIRLSARAVIANCDATQTYERLIEPRYLKNDFLREVKALHPSTSTLVVYLGIEARLEGKIKDCCNLWYLPYRDLNGTSVNITEDERLDGFVHIGFSSLHDRTMAPDGCESLVLFCGAPYLTEEFWSANKNRLVDVLVERACHVVPAIRGKIRIKIGASPQTLYRYTWNRAGAYRGWEPVIEQTKLGLVSQKGPIRGLFLAGHWITTPAGSGGVSMVAQSGRLAAKSVKRFLMRDSS